MTTTAADGRSIEQTARDVFGVTSFRPSQREIIDHVLSGQHCLVLMPTGMGKSLCYQLPAVCLDGLAIIVSPLISLMKDQADRLRELGVDAAYLNSSLSKTERRQLLERVAEGRIRLLFVSPERFRKKDFIETTARLKISLLAVDEAHCISQWGSDFRPDYSDIARFRRALHNPVTIALTATATPDVQRDIVSSLGVKDGSVKIFNEGICRSNLWLSVSHTIDEPEKFTLIEKELQNSEGSVIVYFNLIKSLERFSRHLDHNGFRHGIYHGKLGGRNRARAQADFLGGRQTVMLATNAFGMGVDKKDIRRVIHAEIPASLESYYQEIGRAGRDGLPSECRLYYCEDDLAVQIDFLQWSHPDAAYFKKVYRLFEELGDALPACDYEDLQARLHYKNRGDNRLQTVLNLFDRYGVTRGGLETADLRLSAGLPDRLTDVELISRRQQTSRQRLVDMLQYAKSDTCRRSIIHRYFDAAAVECTGCDNCQIA